MYCVRTVIFRAWVPYAVSGIILNPKMRENKLELNINHSVAVIFLIRIENSNCLAKASKIYVIGMEHSFAGELED